LNANALTQRLSLHSGGKHLSKEVPGGQAQNGMPGVIESPGDQSWTDFCGSLSSNVFLLAESGFGELEQS
jgi:hypothetical protein